MFSMDVLNLTLEHELHCPRNMEVVGSNTNKGPRCFSEQETLPLLISTGWFQ